MADCVSIVFAVASLVIQLGELHRTKPADIRYLIQDLETFEERLMLSKNILPPKHHLWTSCDELVIDIEVLLSRHARKRPWQQAVVLSSREVSSLRERLNFQMNALPGRYSVQRESFNVTSQSNSENTLAANGVQDMTMIASRSTAIESPTLPNAEPRTSNEGTRPYLASLHSLPIGMASAINRISSAFSLSNDTIASDLVSLRDSTRSSSTYTTETELSLLSNDLEPYRTQDYRNIADRNLESTRRYTCSPVVPDRNKSKEYTKILSLRTPLIWAIIDGSEEQVRLILEEEVEVLEQRDGSWDWTPLIWSIMEDHPNILELLLERGADASATDCKANRTPLSWAAIIGHTEIVDKLLCWDADLIHAADKAGMTPMALAFDAGHFDTAKCLLEAGHNPDCRLSCGYPLLPLSITTKDVKFAHLLLNHGADACSIDTAGLPVLIVAIQQDLPSIAELLIAKGADVQCTDDQGLPALTLAVKHQRHAIAHVLIQEEANLHAEDRDGQTALLWAIWCSDEEMVEMLVHNGAQTDVADGDGVSAQFWAVQTGSQKIVQLVRPDT